jgi:hypothetical protein
MAFRLYLNALYFPHGHLTLLNNHVTHLEFIRQPRAMPNYFYKIMITGTRTSAQSVETYSPADAI